MVFIDVFAHIDVPDDELTTDAETEQRVADVLRQAGFKVDCAEVIPMGWLRPPGVP